MFREIFNLKYLRSIFSAVFENVCVVIVIIFSVIELRESSRRKQ